MEIPVVCIDVQRAGPATGVPTKTEQGDLWQVLGAGQGDYPRIIAAPTSIRDCFHLIPEIFNLADKFQCPGIVLADLLESEGFATFEPAELDFNPPRDRGEVIGLDGEEAPGNGGYKRYRMTESGISPRAVPGTPGHVHVVATDEHDEDGVLISDEFTDPHKRQAIMERRGRKMDGVLTMLNPPRFTGPAGAEVTLLGWGSTEGVIDEAVEQLAAEGIEANHLQIRWLVPLQSEAIARALSGARNLVIVENNYSGQFARYLRSETGIAADAHIRKYDGEPFLPHHVADGVKQILAGKTDKYVPVHESASEEDGDGRDPDRAENPAFDPAAAAGAHRQGLQGEGRPRLVPRLRGLRRPQRAQDSHRRVGPLATRGPHHQRHRLLLQLAGLHQHLRHAHLAWARAGGRDRSSARQP